MTMDHMQHLSAVALNDVTQLHEKEKTYQGSWKRRGGVGAWMMAARKIDRLEVMVPQSGYDVFKAIQADFSGRDGTVLAEIRDLRRYLLLIEAEMVAQGIVSEEKVVKDNVVQLRPEDKPQYITDGEEKAPPWPYIHVKNVKKEKDYYLADRREILEDQWTNLPRLYRELNFKEYEELPAWYQPLYEWDAGAVKYCMVKFFQEKWAR